jgi:two-component system cell cycle sensor histidine kinase/response regulator CckA
MIASAPMKALRLLLVEDSEDDALLVLRELRRGGYDVDVTRVETADAMARELADCEWDLVISDYSLPHFSAPESLKVLRESGRDLPFIITSGTIGEDTAVEAMRYGAHDFLVKSRLARLVPAVEREMRDAAERRAHRAAEESVKRLEEQFRHAQKMEAIGRLAGGVAHDFNNILTAIMATADLALETPALPLELQNDLKTIRESGAKAASITRQLLAFSRKQVVQPRPIDLNGLIRESNAMLGRLLPPNVELELDLRATGIIEIDPTQMEQVLLNLVVNAGDAMPEGGRITVATTDLDVRQPRTTTTGVVPLGNYTVLCVRDTGVGMDEAIQTRIFEPFFTTKGPGRGTGLGLATVYGIVQQANGHIILESAPGRGTTFELYFERVNDVPAAVTSEHHIDLRGSEVVLLVEDEPSVRAPMSRALRDLGYFVLEAKDGEDALTVLNDFHQPVHLVVSDVVMPRMSGAELARSLHDWYPRLKVLFVSGYSEELLESHGFTPGSIRYLAKPFTAHQLAAAVRALLDD